MLPLFDYPVQVKEGQKAARRRVGSRLLVGVGLGAMVLAVLGFLPGCGSDSTPGSVKGKNANPAAGAETAKPLAPGAMLVDQQGTVPGKVKKRPDSKQIEVLPGITQEALEAKLAESRKRHLSQRNQEVFPGITQTELNAKLAASRERHLSQRGQEIFPGITKEALDARLAQSRQRHLALRGQEVFPGVTQQALEAKLAESRQRHDPRNMTLPGEKPPTK